MSDPETVFEDIRDEVQKVLVGNEDLIEYLTISILTRGHVLLEGVPGIAKTTLANLFARSTGLSYSRIQMTPDLLPADVTGTHVYQQSSGDFNIQKGPIFANIVVADEINRATPKTQSALLEAMQERHATIEGETFELPDPFMVIATQNPIEMEGTFELPEAQLDRFQFKLDVESPSREDEIAMLDRFDESPDLEAEDIDQVVSLEDMREARDKVREVYVDDKVKGYIQEIVEGSRRHPDIEYGGSPRSSLFFMNAAKARAAIDGREYVIPDDIKAIAYPILNHRLMLSVDADLSEVKTGDVIDEILRDVQPPTGISREDIEESVGGSDGGADAEVVD